MFQASYDKHPGEEALYGAFDEAGAINPRLREVADRVAEARAAGIPLATIIALLVQYGPQFLAVIKMIIEALKTPVPQPPVIGKAQPVE